MKSVTYEDIQAMKGNGSSTRGVLNYFLKLGATVELAYENDQEGIERYYIVTYDGLRIPLRASKLNFYSGLNSLLAQTITTDKAKTSAILNACKLPTPFTVKYESSLDTNSLISKYSSLVVKPLEGAHGEGITVGVKTHEQLRAAVHSAQKIDQEVLVQQFVSGDDHRVLFVNYAFAAAVRRTPAAIVGDGTHTIRQLVENRNADKAKLWQDIRSGALDADTTRGSISKTPIEEIVAARGEAFLETVPKRGAEVRILDKANVSLGGQTEDVTDLVNTKLIDAISNLLRDINLPICGVDIMSTDISSDPEDGKSYIIELNAAPGLRLHELPMLGEPKKVCALVAESIIQYYRSMETESDSERQ